MDYDGFVLSIRTENSINDFKNLAYLLDFSNLDINHELFSNKNKKLISKYKIETPKIFWIDEFVGLGSKAYSFNCNDKSINKLKGIFLMSFKTYYFWGL